LRGKKLITRETVKEKLRRKNIRKTKKSGDKKKHAGKVKQQQ
jgi:hypothetical protein